MTRAEAIESAIQFNASKSGCFTIGELLKIAEVIYQYVNRGSVATEPEQGA